MRDNNTSSQSSGFALLITLIVVSVVISIGITLLDLTIKQLRLSTGSKDSENSFHAANAGVECIRYWRAASSTEFEVGDGDTVPIKCFGISIPPTDIIVTDIGTDSYLYEFEVTWGASGLERCSRMAMITISPPSTGSSYTLNNIPNYIVGYPDTFKVCEPGGRCTIISVQGYNRSCSANFPIGTIQREVLLEL
jgi:hypothetical protein